MRREVAGVEGFRVWDLGFRGTFGCVRINSPSEGSRVKQLTSCPIPRVRTKQHEEPYRQYPEATILRPVCDRQS
jgi:hypothetical protein